jgi:hypothetical protein
LERIARFFAAAKNAPKKKPGIRRFLYRVMERPRLAGRSENSTTPRVVQGPSGFADKSNAMLSKDTYAAETRSMKPFIVQTLNNITLSPLIRKVVD